MQLRKLLGPPSIISLLVSEILLILSCYVVAAFLLLDRDPIVFLTHNRGLTRLLLLTFAIVGGLYFQDLYERVQIRFRIQLVQQVCLAVGLAFLLQAMLNYADSSYVLPRWIMLLGSAFVLIAVPVWRILYGTFLASVAYSQRLIFLGCSDLANELHERFRRVPELGINVVGFLRDHRNGDDCQCQPVLGAVSDLASVVESHGAERLVVAFKERRDAMPQLDLLELRLSGIEIEDVGSTYETAYGRVCVPLLRPSQLIYSDEIGPQGFTLALQSLYATVLAAIGVVLCVPIMLVTALLVKITSRGPVFYSQQRVGFRGRLFTVYKFRTMYTNAESATGAVWATENDPRITPLGRWLRRYRIDETPQLFNVLLGDMTIVGPRPERPEFVKTLSEQIPFYRQRLLVKPGITGWAQISHKYSDSIEDTLTKLEYDLYYIKNISPAMDAYVMFHTAKVILLGKGAR